MQVTVSHPVYGLITYEESFWTGKKTLRMDGVCLVKKNKTTFEKPAEGNAPAVTAQLTGNFIKGVSLTVGEETIILTEKAKTADYLMAIIPAIMTFLVVGGAIGGALAGGSAVLTIYAVKSKPTTGKKVLTALAIGGICMLIGLAIVIPLWFMTQA